MRRLVASWFGTGLILGRLRGEDAGSGTLGALLALLMTLAIGPARWAWQLAAAVATTALSFWSIRPYLSTHQDPSWIVVDEAAGTFVATIGLDPLSAMVGWLVFRVADIGKRFFPGVAAAERLPGPIGVTADDLVAGLYGLGAGWLLQAITT